MMLHVYPGSIKVSIGIQGRIHLTRAGRNSTQSTTDCVAVVLFLASADREGSHMWCRDEPQPLSTKTPNIDGNNKGHAGDRDHSGDNDKAKTRGNQRAE